MKKFIILILIVFLIASLSFSFKLKDSIFIQATELRNGNSFHITDAVKLKKFNDFIENEILLGNLKLSKIQCEELENYVHQRYDQYYCGIRVWGAQIIRHLKNGFIYCINGKYYDDIKVDVKPLIDKNKAIEIIKKIWKMRII